MAAGWFAPARPSGARGAAAAAGGGLTALQTRLRQPKALVVIGNQQWLAEVKELAYHSVHVYGVQPRLSGRVPSIRKRRGGHRLSRPTPSAPSPR